MYLRDKTDPDSLPPLELREEDQRRARLVHLLRTPSEWPEGFVWDYSQPCKCAMEVLCSQVTGTKNPWSDNNYRVSVHFDVRPLAVVLGHVVGLTPEQAAIVFTQAYREFGDYENAEEGWSAVTPFRVADLIEHLAPIPVRQ